MNSSTEQGRAEAAYSFDELLEASMHAKLVFDFDLIVLAQNSRHEAATGTAREQSLGQFIFDVWPKNPDQDGTDTEEVLRQSLARVRETGTSDTVPRQRHDLEVAPGRFESHYWDITHSPLRRGGKITAVVQTSQLVTAEVREERRLAAQRRAAMAGAGVTFFEFNPETDYFNRSGRVDEMFGYTPGEVGQVAEPFFSRVHEEDLPDVRRQVEFVMGAEGRLATFDYRVCVPGETQFRHVRALGEAVTDPEDGYRKLVGIFVDRTEDVRLQESLQEAVDGKEMLLAEMNHRVSNSLSLASSMLRVQATEQQNQAADALQKASRRINAIAAVHRRLYQDGNVNTVKADRFLGDLLSDHCGSYDCDERNLEIIEEVEPLTLSADRAIPLGMVFGEFVTNAFKYGLPETELGTLRITLASDKELWRLSVMNTGSYGATSTEGTTSTRMGSKLMTAFSQQLGGKVETEHRADGTYSAAISFAL